MICQVIEIWEASCRVCGVRRFWKAVRRAGIWIGWGQTARLMRGAGIEGVRRSRYVRTIRLDPMPTGVGVVYVCFIVGAFSRSLARLAVCVERVFPAVFGDELVELGRGTGV